MTDFCSISDLDSKIIHCIVMRLSTRESLEYLVANGHDISERTYFEHKKDLKKSKKNKLINAVNDCVWNHFKQIDTLEFVQQKLWEELKDLTDVDSRLKVYGMITQNELLISKCRDDLLSVIDRQIESYRAVEVSDRLTFAQYKKFVLTKRLEQLQEKLNEPYKDPLALREPEAEEAKKTEDIRKEIEKVQSELEKLDSNDGWI